MKRKSKALKITPKKADSGVHDVNHDRYLAEFTYARKLTGRKLLTAPARSR
jgi:hypothetical protein